MSGFRYPQFCPLARAAEILGERWTLLIIRELLLSPMRFSELRRRLSMVSPSVLSARVQGLEARGLVARRDLPPPASVSVLELTELGQSLRPVVLAMTRFGIRLLGPPEEGDHFEPSWLRLGIGSVARRTPTPSLNFAVTLADAHDDVVLHASGGPEGTAVQSTDASLAPDLLAGADVTIRGDGMVVMAMASGQLDPAEAVEAGQVEVTGRTADLIQFPELFDFGDALSVDPIRAQ